MKHPAELRDRHIDTCTNVLVGIAVVGSAFHFWPGEGSKIWQVFNFSNSAVFIWAIILALMVFKDKKKVASSMPSICVWGYLVISMLSIAFAKDIGRSVSFNMKLTAIMIAGYSMVCFSGRSMPAIRRIYYFITAAVLISVGAGLVTKFWWPMNRLGFHGNIFKYGTYVGPMAVLCGAYWFDSNGISKKLFAGVLVAGAVLSSATVGMVAAVVAGMMGAVFVIKNTTARLGIIAFVSLAVVLLVLLPAKNNGLSIKNDCKLTEADGGNVRQRYIEWQAELNMLEKRAGAGTAAGAINDYRSEFYYRLVKLNTLKAFDLNGWLACGAEIGIVGLMCLGWVFYCYGKKSWAIVANGSDEVRRLAGANLAALTAAAVANVFGCLMYNGIIIVFVLILAMTRSVEMLWRREDEI